MTFFHNKPAKSQKNQRKTGCDVFARATEKHKQKQ